MLTQRFEDALAWASQLHRNQRRKGGGTPYIAHLLAVTATVLEHQGSEDEAIAALLHDAVEDQGGAPILRDIRKRFGDSVAETVDGCTDAYSDPKPPWKKRKTDFINSLPSPSESVWLVVAADKLHNSSSTLEDLKIEGPSVWERFRGRRDGSLWYYRSVVEALRGARCQALVCRLDAVVSELELRY